MHIFSFIYNGLKHFFTSHLSQRHLYTKYLIYNFISLMFKTFFNFTFNSFAFINKVSHILYCIGCIDSPSMVGEVRVL